MPPPLSIKRRPYHRSHISILLILASLIALLLLDIPIPCPQSAVSSPVPIPSVHTRRTRPYHWVLTCLIFDESQYLLEWITWHHLLGAEHFYLYDHRSTDNPSVVLRPLIQQGLVTLIPVPHNDAHGRPTTFSNASNFFREDFPKRIRSATWASHWDVDEFLYLGNDDVQFPHFLARDYLRDVGGVKLSRRSAGTSGQTRRLRRGELAVMTYLDLETDAASRRKDPGKVTVNVNASVTGVLLGHKMVAGKGPLVNVEGVPATETLLNGDSNGSAVPFSEWFPFLIHHITRSYEECKWKDGWGGDRQGTWRHKMPISICEKQNATTAYYVKGDHMERPNSVETHILSMKPRLCEKMRQLNPDYCNKVNCCSQNL